MARIVLVAALVAVLLVVAREGSLFERAGVVGSCQDVTAPLGDTAPWRACKEGFLTGYPNLLGDACTYELRAAGYEYWRCPERP
jgi:hypothetical protein